ncbi:MAG: hypothetical protein AAB650_02570 [Patescibacteria group bacterium]|mgnify:FL=1
MAQFGNSILPLTAQEDEDEKVDDEEIPLDDDEGDEGLGADGDTPEDL